MFLTDRKVNKATQLPTFFNKAHLIYICGVTAAAELHLADVGFSNLLAGK